jgi:hypothetical protein
MGEQLQVCPLCNTRVLATADGTCPACRRHNFRLPHEPVGREIAHDGQKPEPALPLSNRARLFGAGVALLVVITIVLVFQYHLRYTASLASQAYLGLAPSDFKSYIYQFGVEVLAILAAGIFVYRRTARALSR